MIPKACTNICCNGIFVGVIFGLLEANYDDAMECSQDMVTWLYVMGGYYGVWMLQAVVTIVVVCVSSNPPKSKSILDLLGFILFTFYIAWLIYGNILVYNDANICRDGRDGAQKLWKLMLAIIIIGYLGMFLCCCILCCMPCILSLIFFGLISGEKGD